MGHTSKFGPVAPASQWYPLLQYLAVDPSSPLRVNSPSGVVVVVAPHFYPGGHFFWYINPATS